MCMFIYVCRSVGSKFLTSLQLCNALLGFLISDTNYKHVDIMCCVRDLSHYLQGQGHSTQLYLVYRL